MFKGERLADLRKDRGLGQKELADILGVSVQTLSGYERGLYVPKDQVKEKIVKYFGISYDYLLGIIDDEISFKREDMIILPNKCSVEFRKECLYFIGLLKYKYRMK